MEAPQSGAGRPAPRVSVVTPAHNEEGYLEASVTGIVDGLRRRGEDFEVVICENGSTDATAAVAGRLTERFAEVRFLSLPAADYGRALRAGFLASSGRLVVNFDVDYVDLGFLDQALRLDTSAGADVVIGTKRGPGADDTRPAVRRVVTGVFSAVLRYGFGLRASDTHGLKMLRRSSMAELVTACRSGADIFDTELVLRAERAGLVVTEVPVRVTEQRPARTGIAGRIPRTLLGLARLRLRLWREAAAAPGGFPARRPGRRPSHRS
jgi:glycosyltransferase involved in cell wall biosynthesis